MKPIDLAELLNDLPDEMIVPAAAPPAAMVFQVMEESTLQGVETRRRGRWTL